MTQTISSLDNIIKYLPQTLKSDAGGRITARPIYCGHYEVFYLKSAYYVDAGLSKVSVPITVSFGNSTSNAQSSSSLFTDGLGIKMPGKPFGFFLLGCDQVIPANTDLVINLYVANGDIIDNINYVTASEGLSVQVTNFPAANSAYIYHTDVERLVADKANDLIITTAQGAPTLYIGNNNCRVFTGMVTNGSFIDVNKYTKVRMPFSGAVPVATGRVINSIDVNVNFRKNIATTAITDLIKVCIDGSDVKRIQLSVLNFNQVYSAIPYNAWGANVSLKYMGAPIKITGSFLELDFRSIYGYICENSEIQIGVNII